MNFEDLFASGLDLIGTFNFYVGLSLFILCLIGELAVVSIPYLLETTWLLAGYELSARALPFYRVLILLLVAELGRQAGALILYYLSSSGSAFITKYLNRLTSLQSLKKRKLPPLKILNKINLLSPFSVALGRLLWLRIPLTLVLGAKKKLKVLVLGILISSTIWDGAFVILGAVAGNTIKTKPIYTLLFFLACLTTLYLVTLLVSMIKHWISLKRGGEKLQTDQTLPWNGHQVNNEIDTHKAP